MNETELNNLVAEVAKEYAGKIYDAQTTPWGVGKDVVDKLNFELRGSNSENTFFFDVDSHSAGLVEVWYGNRTKAGSYSKIANIKAYKCRGRKRASVYGSYYEWLVKSVNVEYCALQGNTLEDLMRQTEDTIAKHAEEKRQDAAFAKQVYEYMIGSGMAKDKSDVIRICKVIEKLC